MDWCYDGFIVDALKVNGIDTTIPNMIDNMIDNTMIFQCSL